MPLNYKRQCPMHEFHAFSLKFWSTEILKLAWEPSFKWKLNLLYQSRTFQVTFINQTETISYQSLGQISPEVYELWLDVHTDRQSFYIYYIIYMYIHIYIIYIYTYIHYIHIYTYVTIWIYRLKIKDRCT